MRSVVDLSCACRGNPLECWKASKAGRHKLVSDLPFDSRVSFDLAGDQYACWPTIATSAYSGGSNIIPQVSWRACLPFLASPRVLIGPCVSRHLLNWLCCVLLLPSKYGRLPLSLMSCTWGNLSRSFRSLFLKLQFLCPPRCPLG